MWRCGSCWQLWPCHSLGWRSPVLRSYGSGLVAGPLQLAGGMLPGTTRMVLWSLAVLTDVVGAWVTRRPLATVSVRPLHYTHRYGLLIILVLGESVIEVGIVAVDQPLTPARMRAIGIGYTLVCTLWWAYFIYGVRAFRQAVERTAEQADLRRSVMVYGHVPFSFGIIMVAVGLAEVVMAPVEPFRPGAAALLFGGAALFLTTFAYTHWRIEREIAWRRISAGALCLVLLPLAPLMPALAALTTLLAVVVGLNVLEELILLFPDHHRSPSFTWRGRCPRPPSSCRPTATRPGQRLLPRCRPKTRWSAATAWSPFQAPALGAVRPSPSARTRTLPAPRPPDQVPAVSMQPCVLIFPPGCDESSLHLPHPLPRFGLGAVLLGVNPVYPTPRSGNTTTERGRERTTVRRVQTLKRNIEPLSRHQRERPATPAHTASRAAGVGGLLTTFDSILCPLCAPHCQERAVPGQRWVALLAGSANVRPGPSDAPP
ncbi:low temperature requirement protein A [Micromonospora sp. NPDC023966]|uniref:low temperature requirement protein A n=1 Tax=Micromonospora sp. NPDC023966 TaxID=3154699 RepID=UPI0033F32742